MCVCRKCILQVFPQFPWEMRAPLEGADESGTISYFLRPHQLSFQTILLNRSLGVAALLDFVLLALRALRSCDSRNGAMIGYCVREIQKITEKLKIYCEEIQKKLNVTENPKFSKKIWFFPKNPCLFVFLLIFFYLENKKNILILKQGEVHCWSYS